MQVNGEYPEESRSFFGTRLLLFQDFEMCSIRKVFFLRARHPKNNFTSDCSGKVALLGNRDNLTEGFGGFLMFLRTFRFFNT